MRLRHQDNKVVLATRCRRPAEPSYSTSRTPQNDLSDPRGRVAIVVLFVFAILRLDRDHPALAPSLQDQTFDFVLAGPIPSFFAVFGAQIEAFEVAEPIIANATDFAGHAWPRSRSSP